jgi:hypothetical protein
MDQQTKVAPNPNAELLLKLQVNKETAFKHRRRRHFDWTDNYTLYRDKVMLNRLTQRQSVNIPLIKSTIKTLLKDVDDPPILYFHNLDNMDQPEVYYNEYWVYAAQKNNLILKDIQDKRQVMLFGRSFKFLNIHNGHFFYEIVDPQDVLIDRYVDPTDIDTARFVIREHIYKPLSSLRSNPKLDNAAVKRLQTYLGSDAGLIKASANQLDWVEKQRREASLGVIDAFIPILGETYVELNEWWIKEWDETLKEDVIKYLITAEDMEVLYSATLEECIGDTADNFWRSHYPISTWADETERTDFWSDGVADTLRTLNKILNSRFSQWIENGTLRNFNMNYFNSSLTDEGFLPQTFEPVPWGWYPIPVGEEGKIKDNIMNVEVPDLGTFIPEVQFIMEIAQQASAATTFQQGVQPEGQQITLGEVQLLLKNAQEKVKSMAIYYTEGWKDFGLKYTKLLEASPDRIDEVTIHKKGRLTKKNYSKTITPKDWYTKQGYKVEVTMKEDMESKTADDLQKLQYPKSLMPMNHALDTIIKRKSLEFADLTSSEIAEVQKEDDMQQKQMALQPQMMQPGQPGAVPPGASPGQPPMNQPQLPPGQPMQQPMMAH